ncbi:MULTISPECIES: serine/threonine-protein kinase [unclassified Streptomyces]|uniref:serine/threonine-protein kinase n=1 Tax=unclassified Streptomyces TaxID=2593676 RepID=UPI0022563DDC|nr:MULTISPECIES: serine/threonine-protein kinase [unclassified Streptomyces]MCX4525049.1 serine/threonine protein kinase [Streptomyces sp. NBC_01551]MCX4544440.1 serine/threonine protein kinase [Streptomyces sp. NBC_01565]
MGGGGRVIAGRYRLLGPLGRGGMGIVWRARDEVLGREVAVKEVRAPAGLDQAEVARMYRRLEREAWAAARVSHRGVVTVYDVATEDGRPWIVMELVRGLSLADVLEAEGPLTPQRAAHYGEQVLAALRSAHEAGVLHRDVKPANVLIANDGRVVLSDFGIASLEGSSAITMTGEVIGSPEFLAPERALGRDPGPESDLWSLGVMLYQAVEGTSPFRQDTPLATLRAVVDEELPPPRRAGPLEPVLEGLLRKDPAERLPAPEAARMLRIIGAGGDVRTVGGAVSGPDSPTAVARHRQDADPYGTPRGPAYGGPTEQVPTPATAPLPPPAAGPPQGQGRAGALLTVGIVVLLLVLALLGWLLLKDRGSGDGGSVSPTDETSSSQSASESPSPTPSESPSGSESPSEAAQQVTVHARTVRDGYRGSCPPPASQAPAFTATVEVSRVPAEVEYRWAARGGVTSGPGWQSVTFEEGGSRSRQLEHTELTHHADGTFEDAVRLEVRSPAQAASDWLEFSVTCEEETPTSGASSPGATGSPSPSASGDGEGDGDDGGAGGGTASPAVSP